MNHHEWTSDEADSIGLAARALRRPFTPYELETIDRPGSRRLS
jgi:hypothetical protein